MATLRSNVLISTAAMVAVGLIRPGFHVVVNRSFGPEVNGAAAALVALLFLAALPATAAIPTVMLRHVSQALGAKAADLALSHTRWAAASCAVVAALGAAVAVGSGLWGDAPSLRPVDAAWVVLGVFAYAYWRLVRTLLLATGEARYSLLAELASIGAMGAALAVIVLLEQPGWVFGAFVIAYLAFVPCTIRRVLPHLARPTDLCPSPDARSEFIRFNLYWLVAAGASLSTRELVLLLLNQRADRAVLGEVAVALSLLMVLAFAPRVLELPLVHELSALKGQRDESAQSRLTSTALHWMTVFTFSVGCGAAILARPILSIVGGVESPEVAQVFALVALAFMLEMIVSPSTNLLLASAHPAVLAVISGGSLLIALAWWYGPLGYSMTGLALGLALSHVVRAVGIAGYAKARFGVILLHQPVRKLVAFAIGLPLVAVSVGGLVHPLVTFLCFEIMMGLLFWGTLRQVLLAMKPRAG